MATDIELLIRSRVDPSAFDAIYERHARYVHSYLARRLGSGQTEDLVSEVFVRALEARRRAIPHVSGSALPWLYGIARNVLREHFARKPQAHATERADGFEWSTIDARLDASSLAPEIRRAIAGLSGSERDVLLLVSWEQLTISEAAEALGITAGAARTRLHRARTRAAAALAKSHTYEPQEPR